MDHPPQPDDFDPGDQSKFYGEPSQEPPMSRTGAPQGIGESVRQSRASSARTARAHNSASHSPHQGPVPGDVPGRTGYTSQPDNAIMRDPNTNLEIFEESGPEQPFLEPHAEEPSRPQMTPHPTVRGATQRHDRQQSHPRDNVRGTEETGRPTHPQIGFVDPTAPQIHDKLVSDSNVAGPSYRDDHTASPAPRPYDSASPAQRTHAQAAPQGTSPRNVFDLRDEPHTESSYARRGERSQVDYGHAEYPTDAPQVTHRHHFDEQRSSQPTYAGQASSHVRSDSSYRESDYPDRAAPRTQYKGSLDSAPRPTHYPDNTGRHHEADYENLHSPHGNPGDSDSPYDDAPSSQSPYYEAQEQLSPPRRQHYPAYPDDSLADVDVDVHLDRNSSHGRSSSQQHGRLPRPSGKFPRPRLKGRTEPDLHSSDPQQTDESFSADDGYETNEQPAQLPPEPVDPVVRVAELKLQDRQNLATQAIYRLIIAGTVAIAAFLIGLFLIMTNLTWPGMVFAVVGAIVFLWELTSHGRMRSRRRPSQEPSSE